MSAIVFGCGGTGGKVVEAMLYWLGAGARLENDAKIAPVLIDSDTNGTALSNCNGALNEYLEIDGQFDDRIFPRSLVRMQNSWKWFPASGRENLTVRSSLRGTDESDALMQAGFTPQELDQNISSGLYGRPALGAAWLRQQVFSREAQSFWSIFEKEPEVASAQSFVLIGSVFGGTGAATMPAIADRMRQAFPESNIVAVLLLPYFTFTYTDEQRKHATKHGDLLPEPNQFMGNALVAMDLYLNRMSDVIDSIYVIGDPTHENNNLANDAIAKKLGARVGISRGGSEQKTPMFFHDFLAASAVIDAVNRGEKGGRSNNKHVFVTGVDASALGWDQLAPPILYSSDGGAAEKLAIFARFAYLTLLFVDPWLSIESPTPSDYRMAPFLWDLRSDSSLRLRWKNLRSFLERFHLNLCDVEVTSGAFARKSGFLLLDAWLVFQPGAPDSFRRDAASSFERTVKGLPSREGSVAKVWNDLCCPLAKPDFADLIKRVHGLAEKS